MTNTCIKDLHQRKSYRNQNGVSLVFHAHVDALGPVPSSALEEFSKVGFYPYNFKTIAGQDATESSLIVKVGEGRSLQKHMFVLNFANNDLDNALNKGKEARDIMQENGISGYVEIEQVYGLPIPNIPFNQAAFDSVFPISTDQSDFRFRIGNEFRTVPFIGIKAPLKPIFKENAQSISGDFSVGEIHVTLPRTIDRRTAANPLLMQALFHMGFYGPDVPKNIRLEDGNILRHATGKNVALIDVPMTVSAANMEALKQYADATLNVLGTIGWSNNRKLTSHFPVKMNFEIIRGHHWIGDIDPSTTYRKVLQNTNFSSEGLQRRSYNRDGKIGGYKLFSPNEP